MAGWVLLTLLTILAAYAALGVSVRAGSCGRAELGMLFTAVLYAIIVTPVLLLGYTGTLRPWLLVLTSALVSSAALFASSLGRAFDAHHTQIKNAALGLARLPWDGLRLAARARSFAWLGLAAAALAIAATAWLSYLAPSESWDGFFYHEPIVGFALQNHGFRMVPLPPTMVVQGANGYPRLCEAFSLWFVVFTDKTLIEIGNTVAAPGLMLATFVLARRYCRDPVPAMGWSAVILLMPAMVSQLRSPMIDVEVAFFLLSALHYATRPTLRLRDAVAATLCMALVLGSKSSGLAWIPPLALVAYGRLWHAHRRERLGAVLAVAFGGGALLAAVAALTFVRNWLAFGNPIWPVTYANARLGIHWRGLATLGQVSFEPPWGTMLAKKYHFPTGDVKDIIERDYGYGIPWVVLPLAATSLLAVVVTAARQRLARKPDRLAENLLLLVTLGALFVKLTPNLSNARYNVHIVAIAMLCICWAAERLGNAVRLHEGAIAATLVLSIVAYFWTGYYWGLNLRDIRALLMHSPAARASMNVQSFQMPADVARQREQELGRGSLVLFTQEMSFPGVLWNHRMSNRVQYLEFKDAPSFLGQLEALRPVWVVVGAQSRGRAALESRAQDWAFVGTACQQDKTVAYRRRQG